jgi:hypothetical protein
VLPAARNVVVDDQTGSVGLLADVAPVGVARMQARESGIDLLVIGDLRKRRTIGPDR